MKHELKCLPEYFQAIEDGLKTFEIRFNDRNFQRSDVLILKEFDAFKGYSGREHISKVLYVLDKSPYVPKGYVCMSIIDV